MKVVFSDGTVAVDSKLQFVQEGLILADQFSGFKEVHTKKGKSNFWRDAQGTTLVIGLGEAKKLDHEKLRDLAGSAVRLLEDEGVTSVQVVLPNVFDAKTEAALIIEGMLLGNYRFDRYKKEKKETSLQQIVLTHADDDVKNAVHHAQIFAQGTIVARDLGNEPANILRPSVLAEFVVERFRDTEAKVTVFAEDELIKRQMVGLLTVGKGSIHRPRFIEIRYVSDPNKPLVALVGKGLTFDSGGISLKSGRDISDMRMDMCGSAAVIGALDILVKEKVACNVVGLLVAAENLPDAGSMIPSELIEYPNGVSVQVANTDAEGRLALADGLIYASSINAKYVVDIATLTGAAAAALGDRYAAIFGDEGVGELLQVAGEISGDYVWPLPMPQEYEEKIKSHYADICNIGKGSAGAITAALFLRHFVGEHQAWAHVDMAGPMEAEATNGYRIAGASGYGARLLAQYVINQNMA